MSAPAAPTLHDSKKDAHADARSVASGSEGSSLDDDNKLLEIGYVPSFKREFSNIATVRAAAFCLAVVCRVPRRDRAPADQLRVQHHGPVLERRDDFQHAADTRRAVVRDVVLDPGGGDVLHARCVSRSHAFDTAAFRAYRNDAHGRAAPSEEVRVRVTRAVRRPTPSG